MVALYRHSIGKFGLVFLCIIQNIMIILTSVYPVNLIEIVIKYSVQNLLIKYLSRYFILIILVLSIELIKKIISDKKKLNKEMLKIDLFASVILLHYIFNTNVKIFILTILITLVLWSTELLIRNNYLNILKKQIIFIFGFMSLLLIMITDYINASSSVSQLFCQLTLFCILFCKVENFLSNKKGVTYE